MMNFHKNDGKRKLWKRRETAPDPKYKTSSIKHV